MRGAGGARHGEAGLVRGCCLLVLLLLIAVGGGVLVGVRAVAAPDLGPAPAGTVHGSSEAIIAAALAGSAATQLIAGEHAVLVLSEHDLTVLVTAHNPNPARYRNPQARIRDGVVVVSADTTVGPFGATALVHEHLSFSTDGGQAHVTAQAGDYAVGQLGLPSWAVDRLVPNGTTTVSLTRLFSANPALEVLAQAMECVAVQSDGVHVAFHRPGVSPDSSRCALGVTSLLGG